MDWEEARNRTLVHWYAIRDAIGIASPVELLTEINVVEALCDKAKQDAGEPFGYCERCLFYQQFGGCREIGARMSEAVVSGDWEGLKALVEEFIAHLRELRIPEVPASAPAA